jgi:nucleotide-binding universal stress UspA family protein
MNGEIRAVLVATDLSKRSDNALRRAAELRQKYRADLTVLHVIDDGSDAVLSPLPNMALAQDGKLQDYVGQELLDRIRALPAEAGAQTKERMATGKAHAEILRVARDDGVDLIVLGAHGEHFVKDWLIGTTAERVVHDSDRPTLIVKLSPQRPYERVLVPIDFSEQSRHALLTARRWLPYARFVVLHVHHLGFSAMSLNAMTRVGEQKVQELRDQALQEKRSRVAALLDACGIASTDVDLDVREGYPPRVIPEIIEEASIDLVVMGSQAGARLGSTAEHILRDAKCDVLAIPLVAAS